MSDIIEDIDALIDSQLDAGEPETGYDYDDPDFPECFHCGRDWHGMKITERIERMRWSAEMEPGYRYTEDDSPVLCPGPDFIGPWASPGQLRSLRNEHDRPRIIIGDGRPYMFGRDYAMFPPEFDIVRMLQQRMLQTYRHLWDLTNPSIWTLPENPMRDEDWTLPATRWLPGANRPTPLVNELTAPTADSPVGGALARLAKQAKNAPTVRLWDGDLRNPVNLTHSLPVAGISVPSTAQPPTTDITKPAPSRVAFTTSEGTRYGEIEHMEFDGNTVTMTMRSPEWIEEGATAPERNPVPPRAVRDDPPMWAADATRSRRRNIRRSA